MPIEDPYKNQVEDIEEAFEDITQGSSMQKDFFEDNYSDVDSISSNDTPWPFIDQKNDKEKLEWLKAVLISQLKGIYI